MQNQKIYKIILLGDTSTGKSSFLKNYISNSRPRVLKPTQGFQCLTAISTNPAKWIQIWDTPGQQKYRMMFQAIIGIFDYALVFYDITSRHTLMVAEQMLKNMSVYYPHIRMVLLGNKLDLVTKNPSKRQVQTRQAMQIAEQTKANFVQYSFEERADNMISRLLKDKWSKVDTPDETQKMKLNSEDQTQSLAQCRTCV